MKPKGLIQLLEKHGISPTEYSRGIGTSAPQGWRLLRGERRFNSDTIAATLSYCRQYDPDVTYEDLFGDVHKKAS